ncbi:Virulence sensor histidine kinase PhoQ [Nymphon striatum]|nr:Virulence sensor histidine kinase PhoQ [Nymphon striatum]
MLFVWSFAVFQPNSIKRKEDTICAAVMPNLVIRVAVLIWSIKTTEQVVRLSPMQIFLVKRLSHRFRVISQKHVRALPLIPQVGDSFTLTAGCDKSFQSCKNNVMVFVEHLLCLPGESAYPAYFVFLKKVKENKIWQLFCYRLLVQQSAVFLVLSVRPLGLPLARQLKLTAISISQITIGKHPLMNFKQFPGIIDTNGQSESQIWRVNGMSRNSNGVHLISKYRPVQHNPMYLLMKSLAKALCLISLMSHLLMVNLSLKKTYSFIVAKMQLQFNQFRVLGKLFNLQKPQNIAAAIASFFGLPIDEISRQGLTDGILQIISTIAGLFAIFGRLSAASPNCIIEQISIDDKPFMPHSGSVMYKWDMMMNYVTKILASLVLVTTFAAPTTGIQRELLMRILVVEDDTDLNRQIKKSTIALFQIGGNHAEFQDEIQRFAFRTISLLSVFGLGAVLINMLIILFGLPNNMQTQVQHYLSRARIAAQLGSVTYQTDAIATLRRLIKIVGNLLENACKWGNAYIRIMGRKINANQIEISIEDDGLGVPEGSFEKVLKRGHRLDETMPGTGLGLSIVADTVEAYRKYRVYRRQVSVMAFNTLRIFGVFGTLLVLSGCTTSGVGRALSPVVPQKSSTSASTELLAALQGGLVTRALGNAISRNDRQIALQNEYRALEYTAPGEAVLWQGKTTSGRIPSVMVFGVIVSLLLVATIFFAFQPALRLRNEGTADETISDFEHDLAVYRDQLKELEIEKDRGAILPEEANRARNEIARRLLATEAKKHDLY